ncbi:uncharacterized protein [Bemisia tabaci]|uniref:uncharacterized protein n=1 Tax=Bemisia tabaci TaxID=7038 RepID=UPI003B281C82
MRRSITFLLIVSTNIFLMEVADGMLKWSLSLKRSSSGRSALGSSPSALKGVAEFKDGCPGKESDAEERCTQMAKNLMKLDASERPGHCQKVSEPRCDTCPETEEVPQGPHAHRWTQGQGAQVGLRPTRGRCCTVETAKGWSRKTRRPLTSCITVAQVLSAPSHGPAPALPRLRSRTRGPDRSFSSPMVRTSSTDNASQIKLNNKFNKVQNFKTSSTAWASTPPFHY